MFDPDVVWPVFFATWIVLIVVAFFVFHVSRDAARKRRLFPRYIVGVGALFLGFMFAAGFPIGMVLTSIPLVAFFTWLNLRQTRFCAICGRTAMAFSLGAMPRYCQHCGAALEAA